MHNHQIILYYPSKQFMNLIKMDVIQKYKLINLLILQHYKYLSIKFILHKDLFHMIFELMLNLYFIICNILLDHLFINIFLRIMDFIANYRFKHLDNLIRIECLIFKYMILYLNMKKLAVLFEDL